MARKTRIADTASLNILSDSAVSCILRFQGYGRPDAPVWFAGLEEGLGQMSGLDAVHNLKARGRFRPQMDLAEAHRQLHESGKPIDIDFKERFTPVWIWMAKLMLARCGEPRWRDVKCARKYVRRHLGRSNGSTFLTELSPIPSARRSDQSWREWFQRRNPELDTIVHERRRDLASLFWRQASSTIFCYGSGHEKTFREFLGLSSWPCLDDAPIRVSSNRRCIMLPFFGNGHMSHHVIESLLAHGLLDNGRLRG
jgi:hypothetical protein